MYGHEAPMRRRIISVSQIAGIDPLTVFMLEDGTEVTQSDDGSIWINREYYIGKEMSEIDGQWIVHN